MLGLFPLYRKSCIMPALYCKDLKITLGIITATLCNIYNTWRNIARFRIAALGGVAISLSNFLLLPIMERYLNEYSHQEYHNPKIMKLIWSILIMTVVPPDSDFCQFTLTLKYLPNC